MDTKLNVPNSKSRSHNYEFLVAVILGILALSVFALQAITVNDKTTRLETVLFNTLQFLLTVGFGWFSTRAVSRNEFEISLKKFAVSAYRRISDVEDIIKRLQAKTSSMRAERAGEDSSDLDIIAAIVDDTIQIVNSSIADWADVIGEELIAIEIIKRLEHEKAEIKNEPHVTETTLELDNKIKEIDSKIDELISSLPARLQLDNRREENTTFNKNHAALWMSRKHKEEEGLKLQVIAGGVYTSGRDPSALTQDDRLYVTFNSGGVVTIEDESGVLVGRVLNNTPLKYDLFSSTLVTCYESKKIPVKFEELFSERTDHDITYKWYKVRVTTEPLFKPPRKRFGKRDEK